MTPVRDTLIEELLSAAQDCLDNKKPTACANYADAAFKIWSMVQINQAQAGASVNAER